MKVSMLEGHSKEFVHNWIFHPEYAAVLDGPQGFGRPLPIVDELSRRSVHPRAQQGWLRSGSGTSSVFRVPFCGSTCGLGGCNNQPFNNNTCFTSSSSPFQYACDSAPAARNTYFTSSGLWTQTCAGKAMNLTQAQGAGHELGSRVLPTPTAAEVVSMANAYIASIPDAP